MRVVVASKNPVKLNAVKEGFLRAFPGEEIHFEAGE
jgi:non-canonical (house-cleaning) NTP pyrophosphatase